LDRSASLGGATGTYLVLLPHARQVRHQQLFLAGLPAPRDLYPKPQNPRRGVGMGSKGILRRTAPPAASRPVVTWWQPPLLDGLTRDFRYGQIDLRKDLPPDNPWLAWALHLAHTHAEAHGFDDAVRMTLNRVLIMLLADHNPGELIRRSDFHQVLRRHGNSSQRAALPVSQGASPGTNVVHARPGLVEGLQRKSIRRGPRARSGRTPNPAASACCYTERGIDGLHSNE
jgi:hypothetical protein